jgi:hypothetical protein
VKAKDFYRILSCVRGMDWQLATYACRSGNSRTHQTLIMGFRHSFKYSPLSAVASAVRRQFVDISDSRITDTLNLDRRTYERIANAYLGNQGHSRSVRRKLFGACRLRYQQSS